MADKSSTLKARALSSLQVTDSTIARINKLLSTPAGIESTLCASSYTLLLGIQARQLLARILPSLTSPSGSSTRVSLSPSALVTLISDIRVFMRLWGLLGIWAWGARVARDRGTTGDGILRRIALAQVAVNTVYQVLENGAYLAQHGVLRGVSASRQSQWWLWCSRAWMAHTALDLARLYRERLLRQRTVGEKEDGVEMAREWWNEVLVNVAYAPLTVHFSRDGGLVNELAEGALGSVAGWVGLREAWRRTEDAEEKGKGKEE